MDKVKRFGRPPSDTKKTTLMVGVSKEEASMVQKEFEKFKEKNNVPKLSKSAFLRSLLQKGLKCK